MIIPIKCVTCGSVVADKRRYYCKEVAKRKMEQNMHVDEVIYLTPKFSKKTPEAEVLDEIGLTKYCCRTIMLTHVDTE